MILRGGTVYDGRGGLPVVADVGIVGDRIERVGSLAGEAALLDLDVDGLAVAPGFINMLSWATDSLVIDGRSESDIRQGVTLEVMGEGFSMGPLNAAMKRERLESERRPWSQVPWTTLAEYLEYLERKGVSCNVASFVGATTVRVHELGHEDRAPTAAELGRMQALVRQAMEEGAVGVASALIYAPGFYADTEELIALAQVAGEYGGVYISHLRSEGNAFLEAIDEVLRIAREGQVAVEIYHLKAGGQSNWAKLDAAIEKIEAAQAAGVRITADMYTYTAGATGLSAAMPPWCQEGGFQKWKARLKDPEVRDRILEEMGTDTDEWENLLRAAGSADRVTLVGFQNPGLRGLIGRTLGEVARERGKSPEEVVLDLVIEDNSRVEAIYFLMSEENVKKQIALPWVSFCSDEASLAPRGDFLDSNPHPRAYGNFARLLGRYVRDQQVVALEEAVRRLSHFPATVLGLKDRGQLTPGFLADVVVFDPDEIQDHATYDEPHQFSTGMHHVLVNGELVLHDGEHTGATPGRVVRGPGWKGAVHR